ncbi:MAG: mannose-1-phosphate guanylyltransferase [Prevotella sp.]|nr:mannose-1-phosphate guanylyltransferase [Prevotella sp.]
MEIQPNNYCIILAGGRGKRLWPSSRMEKPKQFVDFFGTGRTQLQSTYDRMMAFIPKENIYVCTCENFTALTHEQLPDLPIDNIFEEPVNRNTAPSVAWAGVRIYRRDKEARVIVVPSDQFIVGDDCFRECVLGGLDFVAQNDLMLTMGVKPTRPEPGYGYIQMGESTLTTGICKVQSFTEKPEREFARLFMESDEFLWNTGMFLSNIRFLRQFFVQMLSDVTHRLTPPKETMTPEEEQAYVLTHYPAYPHLSMDKAALEMSDNTYVMRCNFGWADLGTWHSIYEFMRRQEDDNVIIDSEVMLENCRDNIVKLPKGHVGVINGLEGYIVAEQGDVLLICPKSDSSALIRKYVNEVGIRYGEEFI